jgi:hypothetical protein
MPAWSRTKSKRSNFSQEIACPFFGQAGLDLRQDLGVLALGIELLHLRALAGALFCWGGGILKSNGPEKAKI